MKTVDEIQKGIECCYINQPKLCRICPYSDDGINCGRNGAQIIEDVLEYIIALVAELKTAKRERDAAVKGIIKLCLDSNKGGIVE